MNKNIGFTLVELMAVIAIIALLAMISIPRYYTYLARAKQTEVALNLASLHTAMEAYYSEHGHYTSVLSGQDGIGWKPTGYKGGGRDESFLYTYGFNVPGGQEGVHYFTGKLGAAPEFLGSTYAEAEDFVAGAAADVTGKGRMDVWAVDETRKIENVQKGIE